MSHYFKREIDQQKQGNGDGSSSLHTVVPIFNTKKRRIKQALYSNPSSSQETKSSFSNATSQLNSGFRSNLGKNPTTETKGEAPYAPAYHCKSVVTQFKNNAVNATLQRPTQFNPVQRKQGINAPKNLPCLPKPRPQFGLGGTPLNSGNINGNLKQENIRNKTPTNMNVQAPAKKEMSYQIKDLKTLEKVDKTSKVFTATVKKVIDWEEFREKLPVLFEIYGVMESAISTNSLGNGKSFILKDPTGNMRCTFWEMDRLLPRMTRGRSYRVVGCLDRGTKAFNCVSVRPANPVEVRLASTSTALSELAMQSFITTFKED